MWCACLSAGSRGCIVWPFTCLSPNKLIFHDSWCRQVSGFWGANGQGVDHSQRIHIHEWGHQSTREFRAELEAPPPSSHAFDVTTVRYAPTVLTGGTRDNLILWAWIKNSGERNLLHSIAAAICRPQWTYAIGHYYFCLFCFLFRFHQSFALLLCSSLWGKHDGHCSEFSCKIFMVMFWLAEAAWELATRDDARTSASFPR